MESSTWPGQCGPRSPRSVPFGIECPPQVFPYYEGWESPTMGYMSRIRADLQRSPAAQLGSGHLWKLSCGIPPGVDIHFESAALPCLSKRNSTYKNRFFLRAQFSRQCAKRAWPSGSTPTRLPHHAEPGQDAPGPSRADRPRARARRQGQQVPPPEREGREHQHLRAEGSSSGCPGQFLAYLRLTQ